MIIRHFFRAVSLLAGLAFSWFAVRSWSQWWILPLSVLAAYAALLLIYLVFSYVVSQCFDTRGEIHRHNGFAHFMMWLTLDYICLMCRVRYRAEGMEKLPDGPFLLVSNHRSRFDPMITFILLRKRKMTFVSKPENFRIPMAGPYMARSRFIPVDRENARNALLAIHKASEMIQQEHYSVGIYPEGTRNRTDDAVIPFHHGSFKIATQTHVPVVLMSVHGSEKIHLNFPWKGTKVLFRVVAVLNPDDYANTAGLSAASERIIAESLSDNDIRF